MNSLPLSGSQRSKLPWLFFHPTSSGGSEKTFHPANAVAVGMFVHMGLLQMQRLLTMGKLGTIWILKRLQPQTHWVGKEEGSC